LCIISLCAKFHSGFYPYTRNFIPHLLIIQWVKCHSILSTSGQFHFAYQHTPSFSWNQALIPRIFPICCAKFHSILSVSFCVLSAYAKLHSAYLATLLKEIWIFVMIFFFFTAFTVKGQSFKKWSEGEQFDLKQLLILLRHAKNIFWLIRIIRWMTFEYEYLGEFEFIFEIILGCESEAYLGSTHEQKNRDEKSRANVALYCIPPWSAFCREKKWLHATCHKPEQLKNSKLYCTASEIWARYSKPGKIQSPM
jgi:hypothetical protein